MNDNFDNYANISTRGEELYIPKDLMYNWVKYYYKNIKKENYFISEYNNDIIILPIEKLEQYFDISCKYRIKKSGSTDPSLKHKEEIEKILLKNNLNFDDITFKGKKCFVDIKNGVKNKYKLDGDKYNYQFAKEEDTIYGIRQLSNTSNANVIFTLVSKKSQIEEDLLRFEDDIK